MVNGSDRDELNPYAAPEAEVSPALPHIEADDRAEEIRRAHIMHEASIRLIGVLFYLGAIVMGLGAAFIVIAGATGQSNEAGGDVGVDPRVMAAGIAVAYFVVASLYYALGRGIHRLRGWARWTTVVLTSIGLARVVLQAVGALSISPFLSLLVLVFGGLIFGYILSLLVSAKSRVIFSPGYKAIMAATPHVKPRTSVLAWRVLLLLGLVVLGVIVNALFGVG